MSARKPTERLDAASPDDLARAAHLLRTGRTVAFPTETVYGLGANALDPAAVEQIFVAKQRPHWDPLIVHLAAREQLPSVAQVSTHADALIARFWPGPLTLLLPRTRAIPDIVTAGRELVGVRQPRHPVALALLRLAGVPVAAPSANTFSHTSPTTAAHVLDDLDGRIDAVLDGGPAAVGLESTVVELEAGGRALVYRPGAITLAMLESVLGPTHARLYSPGSTQENGTALPSPGLALRHYAPRARLLLWQARKPEPEASAGFAAWIETQAALTTGRVGVMLPADWQPSAAPLVFPWGPWSDLETLAQRLFIGLRELDSRGAAAILCPLPASEGVGLAIQDRLFKAAKS